jgi:hypothetical protein
MFDVWIRAVTQPRLATYEALLEEAEDPSLGQALKAVAVAGLIGGIISGLGLMATDPIARYEAGSSVLVALIVAAFAGVVAVLIAFLINTAFLLAVSKAFGGQGSLSTQSYLLGASTAPMTILGSVVQIVPVVGVALAWAGLLYSSYLQILGLRAAHKYGWAPGILALVLEAVVGAVLGVCVLLALRPPM